MIISDDVVLLHRSAGRSVQLPRWTEQTGSEWNSCKRRVCWMDQSLISFAPPNGSSVEFCKLPTSQVGINDHLSRSDRVLK